jgi:enoyl-CoA hydratase
MNSVDSYKFERILVERRANGIVIFTINRPERMNAADAVMHRELALLPKWLDEDDEARVAIITGAGRAFCVGGDYDSLVQEANDYSRKITMMRETLQILYGMVECRKPIISAINGAAAGAGLAVALLADISVINEDAVISDGHTRIGLAAGDHATLIWPLLCSMAKAKLYLLTCRKIRGREAERIGLVSLAVPAAEVMTEALAIAEELAQRTPLAIELTKRSLNHWIRDAMPAFESSLAYETLTSCSPEMVALVESFSKRK